MPHPALLPRLAAAVAVAGLAGLVAGRTARAHLPDSAPGRGTRVVATVAHVPRFDRPGRRVGRDPGKLTRIKVVLRP